MGNLSENKDEVFALYASGSSCSYIAKKFGVVTAAVTQLLQRNGVRAISRGPGRLNAEQQIQLSDRYKSGERSGTLCKEYGISQCTVREIAKRHGASVHGLGPALTELTKKDISTASYMWKKGKSLKEIADIVGCCSSVAKRCLSDAGVIPKRIQRSEGRHMSGHGYFMVRVRPDHPMASMRNSSGYVGEHRLNLAMHLGRPLSRNETVHHIDGNVSNNNPSNLQLRQGKHGKHQCYACADCGSRNIKPIPIDESKAA